jgi:hypothetical protein
MNAYQIKVKVAVLGREVEMVLDRDRFCPSGDVSDSQYHKNRNLKFAYGYCLWLPWERHKVTIIDLEVIS